MIDVKARNTPPVNHFRLSKIQPPKIEENIEIEFPAPRQLVYECMWWYALDHTLLFI